MRVANVGEVEEGVLESLVSRVDEVLAGIASVAAELASAGTSASPRRETFLAASTELVQVLLAVRPYLRNARNLLAADEISG
jgi:hypothetical protein